MWPVWILQFQLHQNTLSGTMSEGTEIPFNGTVSYQCESGYHFDRDFDLASFNVTCNQDGSWTDELDTHICVDPTSTVIYLFISK